MDGAFAIYMKLALLICMDAVAARGPRGPCGRYILLITDLGLN